MLFKKLKFGAKLISGFIVVSLILLAVGVIGIMSTQKVGKVADQLLEEEVPLTDAVMEMKYELVVARDLMGECMIETDLIELPKIREEFQASVNRFDEWSDAIINGGTVEGIQVIATDNTQIVEMVKHVQEDHAVFEENSLELMEHRKRSLEIAEVTLNQASTLEETSASVEELSASVEQVSDHAQSQTAAVEESTSSMEQVQESTDEVLRLLQTRSASSQTGAPHRQKRSKRSQPPLSSRSPL